MMVEQESRLAWRLFNLNWLPVAAMTAVLFAGLAVSDFSVGVFSFGAPAALVGVIAVAAHHLSKTGGGNPKQVFLFGAIAQIVMITIVAGPLSYLACAVGMPLQDTALLAADRAIGLDSLTILNFSNSHPAIQHLIEIGYGFIKFPLVGIPIILALKQRFLHLQRFVAAFAMALIITLAISIFVPAIGTYYGLGVTPADFPELNASFYAGQLHDILALRDGSLRELNLWELSGIVSFPSFHAASAVLFIWALWPLRGFRAVAIVMDAWMLIATPTVGAHYMVDVFAGVAVAAISILSANMALRYFSGSEQSRVNPASAVLIGTRQTPA
jgi:hypothetical protein